MYISRKYLEKLKDTFPTNLTCVMSQICISSRLNEVRLLVGKKSAQIVQYQLSYITNHTNYRTSIIFYEKNMKRMLEYSLDKCSKGSTCFALQFARRNVFSTDASFSC